MQSRPFEGGSFAQGGDRQVPVYEYRCSKGHQYEKTESFSAPAEQKCMHCRAKAKRLISRPAVIFKGSGFYSTDNKRSSAALDVGDSTPMPSESSSNGHGHSHGPGGHSHDHGSSETKAPAAAD